MSLPPLAVEAGKILLYCIAVILFIQQSVVAYLMRYAHMRGL